MKFRYLIKKDYPFQKYKTGSLVYPTSEEIEIFKSYPYIFENKTIKYKILEFNSKKEPIKVKCLVNNRIYKIGDIVYYDLEHLTHTISFEITGFLELNDSFKNIIYVCYESKEYNTLKAKACGLSLLNQTANLKNNKIKYLR